MGPPSTAEWNALVQVYAISTIVLVLKYTFSQIAGADREKNYLPEDQMLGGSELMINPPHETFDRRRRIFANDMENIPFHTAIFWAAFLLQNFSNASGNGAVETVALASLFAIYTFGRSLHTISYMFALQPWRSLSFIVALLALLGASALMVAAAFQTSMDKVFAA